MATTDPQLRLARLHDLDNPPGQDHDLVRALLDQRGARRILDLGCGTGLLTATLARPGRTVVGVDPDPAMLAVAREQHPDEVVSWIRGDSTALGRLTGNGQPGFDAALMTANVAQHIPDPDWERTLDDLADVLQPGATLIFDSRNPEAKAWEQWTSEPSTRQTRQGLLTEWSSISLPAQGRVAAVFGNQFADCPDPVIVEQKFAFRDLDTLRTQLSRAGFEPEQVFGHWDRRPVGPDAPLFVVIARFTGRQGH